MRGASSLVGSGTGGGINGGNGMISSFETFVLPIDWTAGSCACTRTRPVRHRRNGDGWGTQVSRIRKGDITVEIEV